MTEINIELAEINAQDFYGANNEHLKRIKEYYPKLKIVARGRELTVFGNEDVLKVFDQKMQRVIQHIHKYNRLSDRELEIIMTEDNNEMLQMKKEDEIIVHGVNGKIIKPQTPNQQKLVQTVYNKDMVFAIGPAGTGKTYTAVALAVQALKNKEVRRIIMTRPAVEAGENLGFLPGDMKDKLDPYLQPLYDALKDMIPFEKLSSYTEKGVIEVAPLAFMRGRTLDGAFVILDEAQNTTYAQMKMFLTRMGKNSKFIITGDPGQVDLPPKQKSGLREAINILKDVKDIGFIYLDDKDVVRHKIVREVLKAYKVSEDKEREKIDIKK
ncbi:PhoH family protein [Empedobacter falsenii]|uniref:PhoH-like protein n=1 Tax=Empedobacter falsenii TaxID=343874 RepID=A0A3R8TWY5_9FLAO|nr:MULTISPECIES: PhoH family protein [Empedobacter]HAR73662.1 PhoH family protein [Flavobacteriaceae bacterium]MDH1603669.1 PhoH family protein [Empedobacter sp. GD03739]MDH1882297.1 PhoH family protein [Empedobacter sp. GD03797]MDH2206466.1 PhoH family protein [Empedobacter sp. GD03644]MDM1040742.1 PhoH family protein [Empedobacter brevis]